MFVQVIGIRNVSRTMYYNKSYNILTCRNDYKSEESQNNNNINVCLYRKFVNYVENISSVC